MASFNKLTIGNQTFDVSVVRELPAQWIQVLDGDDVWWALAIPTDLDYQVGQIYQINYKDVDDDLYDKNSNLYPLYNHGDIETLIVIEVYEDSVTFSKTSDSNLVVEFYRYTGIDNVTNKNIDVLAADEKNFAPRRPDIVYFVALYSAGGHYTYRIPYEVFVMNPFIITTTTFYCEAGSAGYIPVKVLIGDNDNYTFVNINTSKSIPYSEDGNAGGYILSVEDVIASNSVSAGSSSSGTQLLHATTIQNDTI